MLSLDTAALSGDPDGDGAVGAADCDELNASVYQGAEEVCDGVDNDCDGEVDEGVLTTWYEDLDGDGFGDPGSALEACEPGPGVSSNGSDCDDGDAAVFPGATEICNEIDDNCDGVIDEGGDDTYYRDADGDGHGTSSDPITSCEAVDGYVLLDDDCEDTDPLVNPSAEEVCNEQDDDCDGDVDEGVTLIFYIDADADGYGDPGTIVEACTVPSGFAEDAGDCDDREAAVNPGAAETCNGIDDDCDTLVDDLDPDLDPGTSGTWYPDIDGDGYGDGSAPVAACSQPSGTVVDDSDCDDGDVAVNPSATEACNGIDDDCDTLVDDDDPGLDVSTTTSWATDGDSDGYGSPLSAILACAQPSGTVSDTSDCDDGDAAVNPGATEVCNSIDDDCDTWVDDDDSDLDTSTGSTWYTDADLDGYGDASSTTDACEAPSGTVADSTDCDDTEADVNPGATELCDGLDGDCDGTLSWLEDDDDGDGLVACESAVWLRTDGERNNDPSRTGSLGSSQAAALLSAEGVSITEARLSSDGLSSSWLDDVGMVIVVGTHSDGVLTSAQAADLEAWVDDGGSLVWVGYHAYQAECDMVDSLPSSWGVACDTSRVDDAWGGAVTTISTHPLTTGVSAIAGLGGENWVVSSPATTVASYDSSTPVVVAIEPGDGKVSAIADEWPFYNSGTGSSDISARDNEQLVENVWAWSVDFPLD